MGLNLFARRPEWLFKALGLQEPPLPDRLDTGMVRPAIDVFQGGWGTMRWTATQFDIPANTAAHIETLLPANRDLTRLVLTVSVDDDTAAGGDYLLNLTDPVINRAVRLTTRITLAGGGRLAGDDLLPSQYPLVVPPRIELGILVAATAAGETITVRILSGETRAGFKVL